MPLWEISLEIIFAHAHCIAESLLVFCVRKHTVNYTRALFCETPCSEQYMSVMNNFLFILFTNSCLHIDRYLLFLKSWIVED